MIIIRFPDLASKRRALGWLAGRFSFKTWETGEVMVPANALPALAWARFRYAVEGRATYEQMISGPCVASVSPDRDEEPFPDVMIGKAPLES